MGVLEALVVYPVAVLSTARYLVPAYSAHAHRYRAWRRSTVNLG